MLSPKVIREMWIFLKNEYFLKKSADGKNEKESWISVGKKESRYTYASTAVPAAASLAIT